MAKGSASFLSGPSHQLTRSLEKILEDAHLSGELRLSGKKLRDFPKSGGKYDLSDTVIADLSKNRFWDLPHEVTDFASLERLDLYHNAIRSLPDSVCHLQSLVHLDLSRNQLSALPAAVCQLPLQVLLLGHNKLLSLPEEIGQLKALMALDVSCNLLCALPAQVGELTELRALDVSSNMLNELPIELTYLQLERLDLSGNQICALPVELRTMTSLVHLSLDHNPLTSPPAKLCARGRVHVFKYLESKIASDSKKQRNEEWRRAQRKLSDPRGGMRSGKRANVDSGYCTSDNWSHEVLTGAWDGSREHVAEDRLSLRSPLLGRVNGNCSISAASTPSSGGSADGLTENDLMKEQVEKRRERSTLDPRRISESTPGVKFSPDDPVTGSNGIPEEKRPLEHIQTYREYKEALKHQRAQEGASIYRPRITGDQTPPSPENQTLTLQNGHDDSVDKQQSAGGVPPPPSSCPTLSQSQSSWVGNPTVTDSTPKRPVQKVTPSRNLNLSNGNGAEPPSGGYTKPASPTNGVQSSNTSPTKNIPRLANSNAGYFSPSAGRQRSGPRSVRWGRDVPPDKLSFTMRREFEKAREEAELLKELRTQIEARLKMELPEEMAPSLADGVVLCHLANHVRPRSVASIHVPSPAVPKLTMARCRRNVDNFLEACRKIGVEEDAMAGNDEIVVGSEEGLLCVARTVLRLVEISEVSRLDKDRDNAAPPASRPPLGPHDTIISYFCLFVFLATLILLYLFPLPS